MSGPGSAVLRYSVSLNAQRHNVLPHSALNGNRRSLILYPNRAPPRELFKPFGCAATLLKDAKDLRNKTMPRGMSGIYVTTSLPLGQHGYLIWVPERHQFVTATHAVFGKEEDDEGTPRLQPPPTYASWRCTEAADLHCCILCVVHSPWNG